MTEPTPFSPIELLTFKVADQDYSLDIKSVREIRGWTDTMPMPDSPESVRGVINLRGTVLPVIDLAQRLNLKSGEITARNVIIVVNINDALTGLLVDAVSDIVAVKEEDLQEPPEATTGQSVPVVRALTLINEKMIRVLDIAAVVPNATEKAA